MITNRICVESPVLLAAGMAYSILVSAVDAGTRTAISLYSRFSKVVQLQVCMCMRGGGSHSVLTKYALQARAGGGMRSLPTSTQHEKERGDTTFDSITTTNTQVHTRSGHVIDNLAAEEYQDMRGTVLLVCISCKNKNPQYHSRLYFSCYSLICRLPAACIITYFFLFPAGGGGRAAASGTEKVLPEWPAGFQGRRRRRRQGEQDGPREQGRRQGQQDGSVRWAARERRPPD